MMQTKDEKPHYLGHRQRLRERFMQDNGRTMPDYELLEMLLMLAIPRRDVKPLAKNLIAEFGSFAKVIAASNQRLELFGLSQNTIAALKLVEVAAVKMSWQKFSSHDEPVIADFDYMIDFCRTAMAHLDVEEFRVIFLDASLHVIKQKVMQSGSADSVAVHPREVVKEALNYGARSIILLHNHPGGKALPSKGDREITAEIVQALWPLKIKVHDHIIMTENNYYSFRNQGLIKYPEDK